MTWAVLTIAALVTLALVLPWALRGFRRWRLRRGAPGLRPYDEDLRARRGRQRP